MLLPVVNGGAAMRTSGLAGDFVGL
uniref:Uncharacterized protein n=1 Tax=Rhizophora mucronata TaxID=61149 RepID=A0A2P2KHH7_RHIMU